MCSIELCPRKAFIAATAVQLTDVLTIPLRWHHDITITSCACHEISYDVMLTSRVKDVQRVYGRRDSSFSATPEARSHLCGITETDKKNFNIVTKKEIKITSPKDRVTNGRFLSHFQLQQCNKTTSFGKKLKLLGRKKLRFCIRMTFEAVVASLWICLH